MREAAESTRSVDWGSRVEFVYQALITILQSGHLSGGERIREEEIAQLLGVSRTPVRTALQRLQQKGLLDVTDGRSLGVVSLTRQQVVELYEMRQILEGWSARLAAQRASETEIALLRQMVKNGIPTDGEPARRARLNRELHEAIHQAAHNRYLLRSLNEVHDAIALLGRSTLLEGDRARQANAEHDAIVSAIEARDTEAAERAAQDHALNAMKMRLEGTP